MATSTETRPVRVWRTMPDPRLANGRRRVLLRREGLESLALFASFYAAYCLLGHRVVVEQHVIVFDGLSRLAHAYFAWYNAPPKLAAIGFEWPPMMTLVFLPFAAIKPLATSFFALTLTSAAFAAGTLVMLNRVLARLSMNAPMRLALIVAFAVNPMFVYYAINGMAEVVYLFFLTFSVHYLVRWHVEAEVQHLALAGVGIALALLSRYELLAWALAMSLLVFGLAIAHRRQRMEVEGSWLLFNAPIFYCVILWCFFNWLILGHPLFWLSRQAGTNVTGRGTTDLDPIPLTEAAAEVLSLNLALFPLIPIVLVALVVWAIVRRDLLGAGLACFLGINAVITIALVNITHDKFLYQLRYNIRPMTIALIGIGWLYWCWRRSGARFALWVGSLAVLLVSIPLTWNTMKTFPYQFEEEAFVRALETGRDQEGTTSLGMFRVGAAPDRDMAAWIKRHVRRRNAIQTDDSQTFSVMLASARPDLFLDRIDRGDRAWRRRLTNPFARVDYFLFSRFGVPDGLRACYPSAIAGGVPWLTVAHQNRYFVLMRVSRARPGRPGHPRDLAGPPRPAAIRCAA